MKRIAPLSRKQTLTAEEMASWIERPPNMPRPSEMKRADCCWEGSPRPCPLVSCKYNNYLNVTPNGTIQLTWPDRQPEEVTPQDSCALDVAARGQSPDDPLIFEEMRPMTGMTKQAVESLEKRAQAKARKVRNKWDR